MCPLNQGNSTARQKKHDSNMRLIGSETYVSGICALLFIFNYFSFINSNKRNNNFKHQDISFRFKTDPRLTVPEC